MTAVPAVTFCGGSPAGDENDRTPDHVAWNRPEKAAAGDPELAPPDPAFDPQPIADAMRRNVAAHFIVFMVSSMSFQ
jgi:hypothetical protein